MEMKDSAMHGILDMQTNILEEIREMRRRDEMRHNMEQMEKGAQMNTVQMNPGVISPITTNDSGSGINLIADTASGIYQNDSVNNSLYDPMHHYAPLEDTLPPAPVGGLAYTDTSAINYNPFSYSSISDFSNQRAMSGLEVKQELRNLTQQQYSGIRNTASSVIQDFTGLDASRMSQEDISKHFARRSHGLQNLTGEVVGAGIGLGATAGSLFMPLGAGVAVGAAGAYAASEFTGGIKASLNYQDILLEDGYKAFNALESTGDMGSIGIGRDDRKALSRSMRHIAVDSFLEDEELAQILQGSLDFKLLKSVQDAETFENKFKELVDATRKITTTLGTSIEEATVMLGEFNSMGIVGDDAVRVASLGKVGASFVGEDAESFTRSMTEAASGITAGTAMSTATVAENIAFGTYAMEAIESVAETEDPFKYNYIKNSGGAMQLAMQNQQAISGYLGSDDASSIALSMYGEAFTQDDDGRWRFDASIMRDLQNSGQSMAERRNASQNYLRSLGVSENHMLAQEAGNVIARDTDYATQYELIGGMLGNVRDAMGPSATDLDAITEMGLVNPGDVEGARVFLDMINIANDPNSINQFGSLSIAEQINAASRINTPGFMKRMQFGLKRNLGLSIGDVGQAGSDMIGDWSHGMNKMISGLSDTEKQDLMIGVDITNVEDRFTESRIKERYEKFESLGVEGLEYVDPGESNYQSTLSGNKAMSNQEYTRYIEKAENGALSFEEQAMLQKIIEEGENSTAVSQASRILGEATGVNESGMWEKFSTSFNTHTNDLFGSNKFKKQNKKTTSSKDAIHKIRGEIKEDLPTIRKEINALVTAEQSLSASDRDLLWEQTMNIGTDDFDLEKIREVVGEGDIYNKFRDAGDLQGKAMTLQELEAGYTEDVMSTRVLLEGSSNILGLLQASGVYSEDVFQMNYAKDMKAMQKKAKKDMKQIDKLSDADLALLAKEYMDIGKTTISSFSQSELEGVVEYLSNNIGGLTTEHFIGEDGRYDNEKVYEEVMRVMQNSNTSDNAAKRVLQGEGGKGGKGGKGGGAREAKETFEEHRVALEDAMTVIQSEIEILHRTVENIGGSGQRFTTSRMG